jgi:hypothetical protein
MSFDSLLSEKWWCNPYLIDQRFKLKKYAWIEYLKMVLGFQQAPTCSGTVKG